MRRNYSPYTSQRSGASGAAVYCERPVEERPGREEAVLPDEARDLRDEREERDEIDDAQEAQEEPARENVRRGLDPACGPRLGDVYRCHFSAGATTYLEETV